MRPPGAEPEEGSAVAVPVSALRRSLAAAIWTLHMAVLAFLLVGWVAPWPGAWWLYALLAPVVQVGWLCFDDYCWLSIVEARLRGEPLTIRRGGDGAAEFERRSFVAETIAWAFGRDVSHRTANRIAYGVLWLGFLASLTRLALAERACR